MEPRGRAFGERTGSEARCGVVGVAVAIPVPMDVPRPHGHRIRGPARIEARRWAGFDRTA